MTRKWTKIMQKEEEKVIFNMWLVYVKVRYEHDGSNFSIKIWAGAGVETSLYNKNDDFQL